jgi:SAM-dependent methyltransferase
MPRVAPFDQHVVRYERWFERHRPAYEAEVRAVRRLWPGGTLTLEIGVGTGRFAQPLGIPVGLEPSRAMALVARRRGIQVVAGVGEALPFRCACFDAALMVTTICFLDDVARALQEARRVLTAGGAMVIGFVDRDSPLGRHYYQHKRRGVFYRIATFYSVDDVASLLRNAGFGRFAFVQTIFGLPAGIRSTEPVRDGHGQGSFVVVRARVASS